MSIDKEKMPSNACASSNDNNSKRFCENKKKLCITDIRLEITLSIEDNVISEDDARDKQRVE